MSKNPDWNAFIGYLLHDLKSPLAVISAYSTMIKMDDPDQKHSEKIDTIQTYIQSINKLLTKFQEFNRVRQAHIKRSNISFLDEFNKVKSTNKKLFIYDQDFKLPKSFDNLKLHADNYLMIALIKNLIEFSFDNSKDESLKFKFSIKDLANQVQLTYSDKNFPIENTNILQLFYSDIEIKKPNLLDAFRLAIIHDITNRHKWDIDFKVNKTGHRFTILIDKKDTV